MRFSVYLVLVCVGMLCLDMGTWVLHGDSWRTILGLALREVGGMVWFVACLLFAASLLA